MANIKSKNTSLELKVRKLLYSMGYRYRLHDKRLPGTPDIIFHGRRKIIFVHGCFWHAHFDCNRAKLPATRREFWQTKIAKNTIRDKEQVELLSQSGWQILIVWQCQTKNLDVLAKTLNEFLESS